MLRWLRHGLRSAPVPNSSESTARRAIVVWLLVTSCLLPLAGCSGCWSNNSSTKKLTPEEELEEKEKKKKKLAEKPKQDFELAPSIILPNESGQDVEDDGKEKKPTAPKVVFYTKPGHWVAAAQLAKANNFDFQGELRTFAMDQSENPLDIERTDFRLSITRPASLPKGQQKRFDTMFYLPKRGLQLSKSYSLRTELRATRSSRLPEMVNVAGNSLREHEYYMVVLAKNNAAYLDLAKLDSVHLQGTELGSFQGEMDQQYVSRFYHVVLPRVDKSVPLPTHPLAWTMIAYLVWDDVDPTILTADQQSALLDWLHWGGQLIVSGPNSLDRLKQSFLSPYLPADSGEAVTIGQDRLQELNDYWSLKPLPQQVIPRRFPNQVPNPRFPAPPVTPDPPEPNEPDKPKTKVFKKPETIIIPEGKPLVGIDLVKHADAEWLPHTGKLVLERNIGQGRVVVTAFSLAAPPYRFWGSRDNFFNACLLRRPGRNFELRQDTGELLMSWTKDHRGVSPDDPRLSTRLRYFTRDIGRLALPNDPASPVTPPTSDSETKADVAATPNVSTLTQQTAEPQPTITTSADRHDRRFAGYAKDQIAGMAGWNDFSGASEAAVSALDDASGIKIPRADFVLRVLLVYLAVLVPINWFVFWLIGRVEYAWLAAPVIAVIGAIAVVRLAQLDIGFASSRTEIAVLEAHAGYPRAHLTRYTALYTSLSTSYDLRFEDPDALALPFAQGKDHVRRPTQSALDVALTQDSSIELSDVYVQSNSKGKVHIEQMLPLKGPILVTGDEDRGWQLENGSQFTLRQAGILRRVRGAGDEKDQIEAAYFPDIEAGGLVKLNFEPVPKDQSWVPQWDKSPMMSSAAPAEDDNAVRLYRLTQLAAKQLQLLPGEMRLIAWTDQEMPGLKILPGAAQSTTYTLVLVHLKAPPLAPPEKDDRLRTDVQQDEVLAEDEKTGGE